MNHEKLLHIDLFSGIGGFSLAADRVFGDVEHVFCEIDPFCQEVLKKHWPEAKIYGDIRTLTNTNHAGRKGSRLLQQRGLGNRRGNQVGLLTGGFPCQPFSQAGRRRGEEDDRFLWPEMLRVIREFSPLWVIAENVRGLLTQGGGVVFERVCTDLEATGYEVQPLIIPAVAVGAPHRRDRVWFVAHSLSSSDGRASRQDASQSSEERLQERDEVRKSLKSTDVHTDAQNSIGKRSGGRMESNRQVLGCESTEVKDARPSWETHWLEVATRLCRVDDGLPRRMDRNPRLKALGNAIVPQVAEEIMRGIKSAEMI